MTQLKWSQCTWTLDQNYCSCLYIPPNCTSEYQQKTLHAISNVQNDDSTIITGDFNAPNINWLTLYAGSLFSCNLCNSLHHLIYLQLVNTPTHQAGNTLDLILTNAPHRIAAKIRTFTTEVSESNKTYSRERPTKLSTRHFPGTASHQKSRILTNQMSARVSRTKVCGCHRGEKWFLPPWKLIFTTAEIDFYHRRNWFLEVFLFLLLLLLLYYYYYFYHGEIQSIK